MSNSRYGDFGYVNWLEAEKDRLEKLLNEPQSLDDYADRYHKLHGYPPLIAGRKYDSKHGVVTIREANDYSHILRVMTDALSVIYMTRCDLIWKKDQQQ